MNYLRIRGRPAPTTEGKHHLWGPGTLIFACTGKPIEYYGRQIAEDENFIHVEWFEHPDDPYLSTEAIPREQVYEGKVSWEDEIMKAGKTYLPLESFEGKIWPDAAT